MHEDVICMCFDKDAEEAAETYAATFPESAVSAVFYAPGNFPCGKADEVLTMDFTVGGITGMAPGFYTQAAVQHAPSSLRATAMLHLSKTSSHICGAIF